MEEEHDEVEEAEGVTDSSSSRSSRGLLYEVQSPTRTRRIPALPMRPATSQEPAPYLQDPEFSTCTVPVLLYASWRGNFFHIFKGEAGWVGGEGRGGMLVCVD